MLGRGGGLGRICGVVVGIGQFGGDGGERGFGLGGQVCLGLMVMVLVVVGRSRGSGSLLRRIYRLLHADGRGLRLEGCLLVVRHFASSQSRQSLDYSRCNCAGERGRHKLRILKDLKDK